MLSLSGLALVAGGLLAFAGAQKVLDPTTTVGALRALRVPATSAVVRIGSAVELLLGLGALVVGGPAVWGAVSLSYLAFGAFVVVALCHGTMIGSCGCFGREDTPPHWSHVVLNAGLAAVAAAAAVSMRTSVLDALVERPGPGLLVVGIAALALRLAHAVFVDVARLEARARAVRDLDLAGLALASGRSDGRR